VRDAIRYLCINAEQQIILILDEFESVIQHQSLELFEELRTIRDEIRTPPRFAYVLVTHRLPHRVVGNQPFAHSGLHRLICNHIYALGPYRQEDAEDMLVALAARDHLNIDAVHRARILMLSGNHAGLIAALVTALKPEFQLPPRRIMALGATPGPVYTACDHLWKHLHSSERGALLDLVHGRPLPAWLVEFLYKRGLVDSLKSPGIFSPIFQAFVAAQGDP
jgi:hypothetical protein